MADNIESERETSEKEVQNCTILESFDALTTKEDDTEVGEKIVEVVDEEDATKAENYKLDGNRLFMEKNYTEALECYSNAILYCPKDTSFNTTRAIYFNNRGTCLFHLGRMEEAIENSTSSIELSPTYIKALMRRAQAYEAIEKHEEALQDINKVLEIEPDNKPAKEARPRLEVIVKEKQEKMKEEMLGKLKDMGNTLLGKFGLSTDNFKMVQDPTSGSYNISFQK